MQAQDQIWGFLSLMHFLSYCIGVAKYPNLFQYLQENLLTQNDALSPSDQQMFIQHLSSKQKYYMNWFLLGQVLETFQAVCSDLGNLVCIQVEL